MSVASSSLLYWFLGEYPGKSSANLLAISEIVSGSVSLSLFLFVLYFFIPFLPPGFDISSSPETKEATNGTLYRDLIGTDIKDKHQPYTIHLLIEWVGKGENKQ